jgi:hypothetical protein
LKKSNTKVYVFQSRRYIAPLVLTRKLKLSEIKDLDHIWALPADMISQFAFFLLLVNNLTTFESNYHPHRHTTKL